MMSSRALGFLKQLVKDKKQLLIKEGRPSLTGDQINTDEAGEQNSFGCVRRGGHSLPTNYSPFFVQFS